MIKSDFMNFISNTALNQKSNGGQVKKSELKASDSFQQILNTKKEITTKSNFGKKSFTKEDYVMKQNNKDIVQDTKNIKRKEDIDGHSVENNVDNTYKEKQVVNDDKNNNLETADEKNCEKEPNSIYSLFAAVINPMSLSSTTDFQDLPKEISKGEEGDLLSLNSTFNNIDSGLSYENSINQINSLIFEESDRNLFYELNNTSNLEYSYEIDDFNGNGQDTDIFTEVDVANIEEAIDTQGGSANSLIPNVSEYNIELETENLLDSDFELKDILLQKTNIDEISKKEDIGFTEEIKLQEKAELKEQNDFSQFNHSNLNFNGKDIEVIGTRTNERTTHITRENIFEQIVEKVIVEKNNTDEIRIKLKPDFLGEVFIKLSNEKGVITAKAYVENYNVKQLIESNLDILKDNIKELGLNLEALDVSVGKDSSFERKDSQHWKQEQKLKIKKLSMEHISVNMDYQERIMEIAGGLYSEEGSIDLIV